MTIVGIDPGKDGAVAAIDGNGLLHLSDTPTIRTGDGNKRRFDVHRMIGILRQLGTETRVFLELVHAMPGQGVTSMFSMGQGLGLWEGIITTLGLPLQFITPQRWKKALMDGQPKDKGASVIVASQLFPANAHELRGPRGAALDGRADALLIAEFGRRSVAG